MPRLISVLSFPPTRCNSLDSEVRKQKDKLVQVQELFQDATDAMCNLHEEITEQLLGERWRTALEDKQVLASAWTRTSAVVSTDKDISHSQY